MRSPFIFKLLSNKKYFRIKSRVKGFSGNCQEPGHILCVYFSSRANKTIIRGAVGQTSCNLQIWVITLVICTRVFLIQTKPLFSFLCVCVFLMGCFRVMERDSTVCLCCDCCLAFYYLNRTMTRVLKIIVHYNCNYKLLGENVHKIQDFRIINNVPVVNLYFGDP